MTRKTLLGAIVLLVILAGIFLWQYKRNKKEAVNPIRSVSAYNQTQSTDASSVPARPKDLMVWTLNFENPSNQVIPGYVVEANIAQIAPLATLVDAEGANFNSATNSLIWTPLNIPVGRSIQKKFTVKIKDQLPAATDTVMSLKMDNEVRVAVAPVPVAAQPNGKALGSATASPDYLSPKTGPSEWLAVILAFTATLGFVFVDKWRKVLQRT